MKKKNIIIILICLIFSSCFLTGCKKQTLTPYEKLTKKEEIKIGVKSDSIPFGYLENGKYKGFDIDVANAVFSKFFELENKKITFTTVTAQDKIMKLNSEEIDFIVAIMSITPQRLEVVDFTSPYFVAGQAIMIKNDSTIKSIQDLNEQNVTVILGTTCEKTLRQLAPNSYINGAKTYDEAFLKIKNGETEAIYGDDSILYGLLLKEKGYKILNKRYTKEYYAIALRKEKGNEIIKNKLNAIIDELQTSGELNKIKQKWIPQTSFLN